MHVKKQQLKPFQIVKGLCQGCILSLCLFNLYEEYIMGNAGLWEAQAGIKIAGENILDRGAWQVPWEQCMGSQRGRHD